MESNWLGVMVSMQPRGITIIVFSLLFLGLITSSSCYPPYLTYLQADILSNGEQWSSLWMRPENDALNAVAATTQAVFAAGSTTAESGTQNVILLKYTADGDYTWNQTWTNPNNESAYALTAGAGSLYLAGMTTTGPYGVNGLLVRLDYNGNEIWTTSYGNFPEEWFTCVAIGSDGIYAAGIRLNTEEYVEALLVKFSFAGDEIWTETWQNASVSRAFGIALGSDGVYLVGDDGDLLEGPTRNAFLAKYSFSGTEMWNTTWGGDYANQAQAVTVFNDDVFVTGSTQNTSSLGFTELFLHKYNSTGSLIWAQYGETGLHEAGIGVHVTAESVFVGGESEHTHTGYQATLQKYNSTGTLIWRRLWKGAGNCEPFGFSASLDGLFFTGTTNGWLTGTTNGFLVKFNYEGKSSPGLLAILDIIYLNPYGSFVVPWTTAYDPDGTIADYELQMDTTPLFEIPMITWRVNQTSVVLNNLQIGTYHFRARAYDNDTLYGPWSNIVAVSVTLVPPTVFNPWLAPAILVLGVLIIIAVFLLVSIRRWRID